MQINKEGITCDPTQANYLIMKNNEYYFIEDLQTANKFYEELQNNIDKADFLKMFNYQEKENDYHIKREQGIKELEKTINHFKSFSGNWDSINVEWKSRKYRESGLTDSVPDLIRKLENFEQKLKGAKNEQR